MDAGRYEFELLKSVNDRLTYLDRINKTFLKISGHAYYYYNFENNLFEVDGDWQSLTGLSIRQLSDTELLCECVREQDEEIVRKLLLAESLGCESVVEQICLKNGSAWLEFSAYCIFDENNNPKEKFLCISDITKEKLQSDELKYMAYYDQLTGIYNRNYFLTRLQELIGKADKYTCPLSLMMLDIDHFKKVNDTLGLVLGDELITLIGLFLKTFETEDVIIGRYGADVFVIAMLDPYGFSSSAYIYDKIKQRLKKPFILSNGEEFIVSMSFGVAEYPEGGENSMLLLKNAELSMYKAKEKNRGSISYFDKKTLEEFESSVLWERRLKSAIENESFELYYQPQFDAVTGELRGAEALVRWIDNDGSLISPGLFIPIAEKNGDILQIGEWVLNSALKSLSEWKHKYAFDGIISINLSAIQLRKENYEQHIMELLNKYDIVPTQIELEITESVLIDDHKQIMERLAFLRQQGIRVSLDDFGTGFSSLSYLKDLPIDTLKIDKSFVDTVISDESTGIITESVVNMVRRLGLSTVAEGVENEQQYEWLRSIHCDTIQGYLLGKPMPRSQFEKLFN